MLPIRNPNVSFDSFDFSTLQFFLILRFARTSTYYKKKKKSVAFHLSGTFANKDHQFLEILENKSQCRLGRLLHLTDKTSASLVVYSLIQPLCLYTQNWFLSKSNYLSFMWFQVSTGNIYTILCK